MKRAVFKFNSLGFNFFKTFFNIINPKLFALVCFKFQRTVFYHKAGNTRRKANLLIN